ncbi:MAG: hypothetical protein HFH35_14070 [Eubacterium sp.]|nr:hypothetical protein [Eubacterium sp.]
MLTVRPLEMLCNSPYGSIQGYRRKNGRVYAIRKTDVRENKIYGTYVCKAQKKIRADTRARGKIRRQAVIKQGRCAGAKQTAAALHRFLAYPDRRSAAAYFSLCHNEEFGMGRFIRMKAAFRPGMFGMALFSRTHRRRLKETAWPQGYFVYFRLYPLLVPYNCLLRRYLSYKNIRQVFDRF